MAYRILSLDGGGAWALIEVKALMALFGENTTGHDVLSEFDLVAANSGGSLVLGGLIENLPLKKLLDYFLDGKNRRSIFSPVSLPEKLMYSAARLAGIGPKYSTKAKLPAIQKLLSKHGNEAMPLVASSIKRGGRKDIHLLIVGFDYDRTRAVFFRSSSTDQNKIWGIGAQTSATLAEAIHVSTNAPVNYFDKPAEILRQKKRFWDGAIAGYNNPVLGAVTEAIVLGQRPEDIVALSLGTGNTVLPPVDTDAPHSPYFDPPGNPGLFADIGKMATSILDDPPDAATFISHVVTGGGNTLNPPAVSRIVRMNPLIRPVKDGNGNWTAPDGMTAQEFDALRHTGMDAIEQSEVQLIEKFTDLWLADKVPNQPIRMDGTTLEAEIGYDKFSEARHVWGMIR